MGRSCLGWIAATLVAATPTMAVEASRLRDVLRRADKVAVAEVISASDLDLGRLRLYELRLQRVLKPVPPTTESPAETVRVVSMADEPGAAMPEAGESGVVFLQPLRRNTYWNLHLNRDAHYAFVDGRDGWLRAANRDDLSRLVGPVEQLVGLSRKPGGNLGKRRRELVFALLSAPHPLLASDGIDSLSSISGLAQSLSESEADAIATAVADTSVPATSRQGLIENIAALGLRQLVPTLQTLADPAVQQAAWAALRTFGVPVDDDTLRERLADENPSVRLAAARELLARDPAAAIRSIASSTLNDDDSSVRLGFIETLGEIRAREAVAPLERVFATTDLETRQATARALLAIGGKPAEDAFHRLAFVGTPAAQRFAVLALLSMGVGNDDPRIQDILARHKDHKVHELIKGEVEVGHHH